MNYILEYIYATDCQSSILSLLIMPVSALTALSTSRETFLAGDMTKILEPLKAP